MSAEHFAELMLLGCRVREVRELAEGALFIRRRLLLLIDADLSADECEAICDETLGRLPPP